MTPEEKRPAGEAIQSNGAPLSLSGEVDQAYLEFCARRERGEKIDADQFCAEHPALRTRLGQLLRVHLGLEAHPAQLDVLRFPETGEMFRDFELVQQLGRGAFARVFLAREGKMGDRPVAVKVSWNAGPEAKRLGTLEHPNIVKAHTIDIDQATGLSAIVMPYQGNTTLADVIGKLPEQPAEARATQDILRERAGKLDPLHALPAAKPLPYVTHADVVRAIGAGIAEALAHLHAKRINHRDLKPSNVLLTPAGEPVLLDFNLSNNAHTTAIVAGTMPYMAPEQVKFAGTQTEVGTDPRSEVYALGVMLFELATGTYPFGPLPENVTELREHMLERQRSTVPNVRAKNPTIERSLSQLIERCLAYEPKDRPQSAAEVAAELHRQLSPPQRLRRFLARHPRLVITAMSVMLACVFATFAFFVTRPPASVRQYQAGMQQYRRGNYDEAVSLFTESLKNDPDNAETFFARGQAFQALGARDEQYLQPALSDFVEAERRAQDARSKAAIGYCANLMNSVPTRAIAAYENTLKMGEDSPAIRNNLGCTLISINKFDKAEENLNRAISLNPKMQAAYINRGKIHVRQALIQYQKVPDPRRNKELARRIKAGSDDFTKAFELGTASAELCYHAALLPAMAAKVDPAQKDLAFQYLFQGIRLGFTQKQIVQEPLFNPLKADKRYQELLSKAPVTASVPRAVCIVNPVVWP
ncbi:MAG TPA: protein kinase [Gemmataceae bacterium]|nr:protein kinase [Gemmataceae bacterium]